MKEEVAWPTAASERAFLFRRAGPSIQACDAEGKRITYPLSVETWDLGLHPHGGAHQPGLVDHAQQ